MDKLDVMAIQWWIVCHIESRMNVFDGLTDWLTVAAFIHLDNFSLEMLPPKNTIVNGKKDLPVVALKWSLWVANYANEKVVSTMQPNKTVLVLVTP